VYAGGQTLCLMLCYYVRWLGRNNRERTCSSLRHTRALSQLCPLKIIHTAPGEPRLLGYASPALSTVVTKTLAKPQAFVPQSHVGLNSGG
jgi:hypothetical protein